MSVPLSPQAIEQIRMRVENSEPLRHLGDTAPDDIRALLAEVARLQGVLDRAMRLLSETYADHRDPVAYDSDWQQAEDVPCEFCCEVDRLRAALPAAEEREL